ncbi:MAG: molecular chaperone HtpG [Methylobacteriaceae bacterium]|nr:molecular chaperone HtpG [Methylobacteriaceae bacterium]
MVHSVYSDRDVFLRELVANAADACERLRYEALADPALLGEDAAFAIRVVCDEANGRLVVEDNGLGMSEGDLVEALGTIARSGTRSFVEKLGEAGAKQAESLIGQFGVGFYSAFMVAGRVVVETRRAGQSQAWRWESEGKGDYAIAPLPPDAAPARGTRVILHLTEAAKDYAAPHRVEQILREHSGGVAVPIDLAESPGASPRRIADGAALWARPKSDISTEQYAEFYRGLSGQFDEPAMTAHWRAEGRHEYHALAFVPGSRPLDLFDPQRKGRGKLYVRRVLITDDADLLPGWLRFVRLVVDSADLPLNVSREMAQQSPVFGAIRTGVANRILADLVRLADKQPESWAKIWENFGAVLKEGLYEAPEKRDDLLKIARFRSTAHPDGGRSLADYVKDLRENQTAIYYLTGDDARRLAASPQLEGFRARGVEVLLLSDPIDAFWVTTALGFDGKPFRSVTQGTADIAAIARVDGAAIPAAEVDAAAATLIAFFKETLGEAVADVRASDRLATSAACLVAAEHGLDRRLERLLAMGGQAPPAARAILEINAGHALVARLAARFADRDARAEIADAAWLLLDEARLRDGEPPVDAAAFADRLGRVMSKALG